MKTMDQDSNKLIESWPKRVKSLVDYSNLLNFIVPADTRGSSDSLENFQE